MSEVIIAVVLIDNNHDALPSDQWRDFMMNVDSALTLAAIDYPVSLYSSPAPHASMDRLAAWMVRITPEAAVIAQRRLLQLAAGYRRPITWSEVSTFKVLTPPDAQD